MTFKDMYSRLMWPAPTLTTPFPGITGTRSDTLIMDDLPQAVVDELAAVTFNAEAEEYKDIIKRLNTMMKSINVVIDMIKRDGSSLEILANQHRTVVGAILKPSGLFENVRTSHGSIIPIDGLDEDVAALLEKKRNKLQEDIAHRLEALRDWADVVKVYEETFVEQLHEQVPDNVKKMLDELAKQNA